MNHPRLYRAVGVQLVPQDALDFRSQDVASSMNGALAWAVHDGSALVSGFLRARNGTSSAHDLDHDEVIHVLGGRFGIELVNGALIEAGPGETLNLARGTRVRYVARDALVFFVRTESRNAAHARQAVQSLAADA